jgi:hypothetical protein
MKTSQTESLCESCSHMREIVSGKGSRFLLCQLAQDDTRFPKYPPQPMIRCEGWSRVVTEPEWLACTDPQRILWWLRDTGRASDRKLRLFAAAYCRHQWHFLADVRSQKAVEVAERYADDLATERERQTAAADASRAASEAAEAREGASELSRPALTAYAATAAWYTIFYEAPAAAGTTCDADATDWYAEYGIEMPHPKLLRCIFGNPFRPVTLDPTWLIPTVTTLARIIYDDRAFGQMPDLADALEAAGCTNEDILTHCRLGNHTRGCWLVDLLLGKE